ncbi:MAG TPA: MBL fold metallo-hydrolase [Cerasibacillus sp.]|uniref:MBL fold metallo-hydrolase n=1 Tax=Cerasibacillus sp. TaxID=2498711 RepID=UPI002F403DD2
MSTIITASELARKIINNEDVLILDIRSQENFDNWKIEGVTVKHINEPYYNLVNGLEKLDGRLKKEQEVVVVCAKGGTSSEITEMLDDAGFAHVYNLEGGMRAWSEHLEPVKIGDLTDGGSLYQFVRLGKGCLSYFIESNGEAAVVDPVRMTETFTAFASEKDVTIKHLIDTHLHADHISGGRKLAEQTGGIYHLPPKDATEVTYGYQPLEEGKDIIVGNTTVKVQPIYSPGHTVGSTSLIIDDQYLLTGDILFVKSIGRPDLAGKAEDWVADLRHTLYTRYKELSAELIVLPAHFSFIEELSQDGSVSARLGDLFENNSGLNVEDEGDFRKLVTENLPPQPNAYQDIRQTNMGKINPDLEEQREMESGPNRCAVEG